MKTNQNERPFLVTGAGGLLGSHLIHELSIRQYSVIAVSSREESALRSEWHNSLGHSLASVDVISQDSLLEVPFDPDLTVINSGFSRVHQGNQLALGLEFQAELAKKLHRERVSRIINISSQSVYDPNRLVPANEDSAVSLNTPYATAKYAQELLFSGISTVSSVVHVRLASLIGTSFDERVPNRLALAGISNGEISIINSPQIFDFMDVRDAASAIAAVCEHAQRRNPEIVNVGSGQPTTLREIADEVVDSIAKLKSREVVIKELDASVAYTSSALDIERLTDAYGFTARYSLQETIHEIVSKL